MNREALRKILEEERFRPNSYYLNGGFPAEALTLAQEGDHWTVYYSERGEMTGKKNFSSEDQACEYFLSFMREIHSHRPRSD